MSVIVNLRECGEVGGDPPSPREVGAMQNDAQSPVRLQGVRLGWLGGVRLGLSKGE